MVQIAGTIEVVARIFFTCGRIVMVFSLVVAADIFQRPFELMTVPCFFSEVAPAFYTCFVVDHHILDDAYVLALERFDHAAQLGLGSKGSVMVEPPDRHVTHALPGSAVTRIGHPDQVENLRPLISLLFQLGPLRIRERIPVEPLQHHAPIVLRPAALCLRLQFDAANQQST